MSPDSIKIMQEKAKAIVEKHCKELDNMINAQTLKEDLQMAIKLLKDSNYLLNTLCDEEYDDRIVKICKINKKFLKDKGE